MNDNNKTNQDINTSISSSPIKNLTIDNIKQKSSKDFRITKIKKIPWTKKSRIICFFCGGKNCKSENWLKNKNCVIKGLDSDWITDAILAMQRPSTRLINEYNICDQLKKVGIYSVFNFQEPGEHSGCGDGIQISSGFSYNPEDLYEHGIFFYNFGWPDMDITNFNVIIRVMHLMDFALKDGKKVVQISAALKITHLFPQIAVHCHAGRGRTLLGICSWLIYNHRMKASDTIKLAIEKRKGVLSKKAQRKFLFDFQFYLENIRQIFFDQPILNLDQAIKKQHIFCQSELRESTKYLPLILYCIFQKINMLIESRIVTADEAMKSFYYPDDIETFNNNIYKTANLEENIIIFKNKINQALYDNMSIIKDIRIFSQVILDFLEGLTLPAISYSTIKALEEMSNIGKQITKTDYHIFQKTELYLLREIVKVLSNAIKSRLSNESFMEWYALRMSIALCSKRKNFDYLFTGRNLVSKKDLNEDKVQIITKIILQWSQESQIDSEEKYIGYTLPKIKTKKKLLLQPTLAVNLDINTGDNNNNMDEEQKNNGNY